jgi:hypothetical protein
MVILGLTAALRRLQEGFSKYQEGSILQEIDDIQNLFSSLTEINFLHNFGGGGKNLFLFLFFQDQVNDLAP